MLGVFDKQLSVEKCGPAKGETEEFLFLHLLSISACRKNSFEPIFSL
jgi:hypothetical protein